MFLSLLVESFPTEFVRIRELQRGTRDHYPGLCFMCLCPLPNNLINGEAYKHGLEYFDCGGCPECLSKRANMLALRAVMESRSHRYNCMCTLTYDQFVRDKDGKVIGEELCLRPVDKKDVQKFIKRVRDYFGYPDLKYLVSAEYGKRTGRPHYHILFFGITFSDAVFYKKSKRGNVIKQSHLLNKLWRNGICTVDSDSVSVAKARYCTKYIIKDSRTSDTFTLLSQKLGLKKMLELFNGKYYMLEGRQYPIPRVVWQEVISQRYNDSSMTFRYLNKNSDTLRDGSYDLNCVMRKLYRETRDSDKQYREYLAFWQEKSLFVDRTFASIPKRLMLLDDRKYHNYKLAAIQAYSERVNGYSFQPPRSNCSRVYSNRLQLEIAFRITCPIPSRPNRASDRKMRRIMFDDEIVSRYFGKYTPVQLSFF